MILAKEVPLREHTTFKTGGPAQFFATCENGADIQEALSLAKIEDVPWYVLGEGSNVLAHDAGYRGVVIHLDIQGMTYEEQEDQVFVTAGAGVSWDTLVEDVARREVWGMENLAGIPGTVGASPVQNIGAYGVELKDVFLYADVLDAHTGTVSRMSNAQCAFSYRDSVFKRNNNLIILSVTYALSKVGFVNASYADVHAEKEKGVDLKTPVAVTQVIRNIRSRKFPDLKMYGTAGSFFKNPVLSRESYHALVERVGTVPCYTTDHGMKVPLAFILDRVLSLRGFRIERAWLFTAQPLVVVLDAEGTSGEVVRLAEKVFSLVKEKTNIEIEFEVRTLQNNV